MTVAEVFSGKARKRAGLSQEELGFRAGLHRTEVSQLERGLRLARIDTLAKLAGALGIEAGDLMAGIRWQPATSFKGRFKAS